MISAVKIKGGERNQAVMQYPGEAGSGLPILTVEDPGGSVERNEQGRIINASRIEHESMRHPGRERNDHRRSKQSPGLRPPMTPLRPKAMGVAARLWSCGTLAEYRDHLTI